MIWPSLLKDFLRWESGFVSGRFIKTSHPPQMKNLHFKHFLKCYFFKLKNEAVDKKHFLYVSAIFDRHGNSSSTCH